MAEHMDEAVAQQLAEDERARKQGIHQLLQANGISEEDVQNPDGVTQIEMVLDDYCCMIALKYFPNLRSVVLIQQAICTIEGLECCPFLERLLLNENKIRSIEGLHKCSRLRVLQLCTNSIEDIGSGLRGLQQLEVFWIAENQLSTLEGIGHAPNLKEINASRNRLTSIVQAFNKTTNLTSINVSDNRICSYRDILDLSRLPSLRELCFSDPDWGENPICTLCNYQTYTLFHLPSLRMHDRMRISEEEHQSAQAAFSKKRLYYNMRIKTIKRIAADGIRWAKNLDDERMNMQASEFESVARKLKRIQAFSRVREENPTSGQPQDADPALQQDRFAAERHLLDWQAELADASTMLNSLHELVEVETDTLIQGLELELQTGGNIRMEPGASERDPWFLGVEELIKARFHAQDLSKFGISDIKVHSVTCVHNRSLRIRLEDMLDRSDSDVQQKLEYFFYVPDPSHTQADIRAAIEEGPGYDRKRDVPGPVVLTNSVTIVEAPRIEVACATPFGQAVARATQRAAKRAGMDTNVPTLAVPVVCGGSLLICSACLSETQAHTTPTFEAFASGIAGARTLWTQEYISPVPPVSPYSSNENSTFPSVTDDNPEVCKRPALYKTRADDPKQQVWLVPQPELVLPEFLVEFDYVYSSSLTRSQVAERLEEHGPLAAIFRDFATHAKLGAPEIKEEEVSEVPSAHDGMLELQKMERINNSNALLMRKWLCCDPDPVVFNCMIVLNLHGRGIRRLEPALFQEMTFLKVLLLSFNSLESVSNIPRLACITHVDISFNIIEKIDTLVGLPGLHELDLSWNSLLFQDSLLTLARDVPQLESLHLVGNPMAKGTSGPRCRSRALARMKCLRHFDGKEVPASEMLQAQQNDVQHNELTEGMLVEHAYTSLACQSSEKRRASRKSATPLTIGWDANRNRIAELMGRHGDSHSVINRNNWKEFVECLDLRRLELTDLCDLKGFPQLRRLLLANNELSSLTRFTQCTSLEELSLECNSLRSLQGASTLLNLQRLDAGSNQIEEVLDLQKLSKLSQLSLEDNFLDSLDTFSMLHGLMELYLSNNLIEELRAVLMLKPLPKLVVLDLSGNGLCSSKDYRYYTIFHLRRLKVLDGCKVTQSEQQDAEERFSGRLTMELLEDKLGPVPACYNLRSVDLSSLNLRDLGNLLNDDMFPSLRELNVEGNPFSDMRTVGPLSKLAVLRMNKSKIDLEKMVVEDEQVGGLSTLPHLQVLEIGESGISDMSGFENFPLQSLRILHLQGNDISKLEGLSHLEQLRELVIDHNKIKQFDENSFQGLRCLRELRAEDNGLKSLANLGPLPRLRALYLSQNRIAELPELEKMSSLKHVMLVHLQQNPVARKPLYRAHVIQAVGSVRVIDGREVSEEEREKSEQLLQSTDPTKAMGLYAFSDQQTTNVGGIYVTTAPEAAVKPVTTSIGITDVLRNASVNGPSNVRMTGQSLESATDDRRGDNVGGMVSGNGMLVARRAVAAVTAANAFARGNTSRAVHTDNVDGNGNTDGVSGSKKLHSSRSNPAPRQANIDARPPTLPPRQ